MNLTPDQAQLLGWVVVGVIVVALATASILGSKLLNAQEQITNLREKLVGKDNLIESLESGFHPEIQALEQHNLRLIRYIHQLKGELLAKGKDIPKIHPKAAESLGKYHWGHQDYDEAEIRAAEAKALEDCDAKTHDHSTADTQEIRPIGQTISTEA